MRTIAFAITSLLATSAVATPRVAVPTPSGVVLGVRTDAADEFRGIPFAAPPVGALRFQPPEPAAAWPLLDASELGPPCVQQRAPDGVVGSEDCLRLNVFVPRHPRPHALPVMVHLHPGGNAIDVPYVEAGALVARDVIVVTVAYRLGVFGFVAMPGGATNLGLRDQIAALRWVQSHIAAFGGDPGNVTVFGMSAGSQDVNALVASPAARGLFRQAIIETTTFWTADATLVHGRAAGLAVTRDVGCEGAADVVACLRATPAEALVRAQPGYPHTDLLPIVDGDLLPDTPLHVIERGGAVPLLIGSNREESAVFYYPFPPLSEDDVRAIATATLGPDLAAAVLELYPFADYDSPLYALIAGDSDYFSTCPTRNVALAATTAPVYRYLFTHVFEASPGLAAFRAAHTFEDAFLWHHFLPSYTPTAAEEQLAATIADYFTNFARTGDPNGPGLPVWPRHDAASEPYLELDDVPVARTQYHVPQCDLWNFVYSLM